MITQEEYELIKSYEATIRKIVSNKSAYNVDLIMKKKLIDILKKYDKATGCPTCNKSILIYLNSLRLMIDYENNISINSEETTSQNAQEDTGKKSRRTRKNKSEE